MELQVEFYGIPRQRSGTDRARVVLDEDQASLGRLLQALGREFPKFAATCLDQDRLKPGYLANVGGRSFVTDPGHPLRPQDPVLILSADAGG
jgi:molybdopterin converting factor small subunit